MLSADWWPHRMVNRSTCWLPVNRECFCRQGCSATWGLVGTAWRFKRSLSTRIRRRGQLWCSILLGPIAAGSYIGSLEPTHTKHTIHTIHTIGTLHTIRNIHTIHTATPTWQARQAAPVGCYNCWSRCLRDTHPTSQAGFTQSLRRLLRPRSWALVVRSGDA